MHVNEHLRLQGMIRIWYGQEMHPSIDMVEIASQRLPDIVWKEVPRTLPSEPTQLETRSSLPSLDSLRWYEKRSAFFRGPP